jgi:hypothetical protein
MTEGRLYTIRTSGDEGGDSDFYTGTAPDGRQVLMGICGDEVVALWFDASGVFLDVQTSPVPRAEGAWGEAALRPLFQRALEWQREIAFEPGPIRVRGFFLPPPHLIGIQQYPDWIEQFRTEPEIWPEEEWDEMRASIADWEEQESYVLWWAKDYYMTKDGEVKST